MDAKSSTLLLNAAGNLRGGHLRHEFVHNFARRRIIRKKVSIYLLKEAIVKCI